MMMMLMMMMMEDDDGDDDDWHKFGNLSRGFREACQLVGRGISNTSEFSSSYPARPNSPNSSFTCRLRSVNTDRHRHRHRHTDIQLQTHHSSSSSWCTTPSSQSRSLRFQQEVSLGVAVKWRRLNRRFNSQRINWKRWNNKITTECLSLTNYSARGRDPPPVPIIPHVFLIPW